MDKEVNKRIRRIRKERGYTQEQIATILGMKRNAYSQEESCGNFNTIKIKKLAEFFKVDVRLLLYGEIPKTEPTEPTIPNTEKPNINQPSKPEIYIGYKCTNFALTVFEMNIIKTIRVLNDDDVKEITNLILTKFYKKGHSKS